MAFHEMSAVNEQIYRIEESQAMDEVDEPVFTASLEIVEREMELFEVLGGVTAGLLLLSGRSPSEVFDLFGGREETERVLGTETLRELDRLEIIKGQGE